MKNLALQEEEKYLLGRYFSSSPIQLLRTKSQSILMYAKGLKEEDIAEIVFRNERTIRRWINDFVQKRIGSIFSGMMCNEHAGKLTRKQKEEIKEVLQKPPSEYGLSKEFWNVPQLKEYVEAEFGVVYESNQSYHFLLKFSHLSFKYPDRFDMKRDEKFIRERMKEVKQELLHLQDYEVFSCDEVGLQLDSLTRRAWLQKGKKTVVKVERGRERVNFIGMLNQKNGKCHLYKIETGNQIEIIKSLEAFVKEYPEKRICIVWDNARAHKGKQLREALGKTLKKVHLINLPPYAPDTNPIEHVWKKAKDQMSGKLGKGIEEVTNEFHSFITSSTFNYTI
jgi:transposase